MAVAISLSLSAAAAETMKWEIDREFKKVERRLYGANETIREGCGAALATIADRPLLLDRGVESQRSDVTIRGSSAADLRPCARAVAAAGIVEGWRATQGSSGQLTLSVVLLRARRDPHVSTGERRTPASDKLAAKELAAIWEDRNETYEALGAEVVAPDLVDLYEARWNAGNLSFEGRAPDDRLADGYSRLVRSAIASTAAKIEWAVSADAPAPSMPELPQRGTLRGTWRVAPAGAVLRLFAEMDRRDFVIPNAIAIRGGGMGGGWPGITEGIATSVERTLLRAGQVDVFAPPGAKQPPRRAWDGKKVTLQLEGVSSKALWTLLSVASGGATIDGPDDLPLTDVQVKNVPWDQVVDAIALTYGCTVSANAAGHRAVECPPASLTGTVPAPPPVSTPSLVELPPLRRVPAGRLRVVAIGVRDTGKAWRAVVRTPAGLNVLVRTGSPIGVDGGLAVVDEHGVSVVLERAKPDGTIVRTAVQLPF